MFQLVKLVSFISIFCFSKCMLAGLDEFNKSQSSYARSMGLPEEQPVDDLQQFRLKTANLVAWRPWGGFGPMGGIYIVLYGMKFAKRGFLAFELDYPWDDSFNPCNHQCGRKVKGRLPPYDTFHMDSVDPKCKRVITLPPKRIASIRYRVTSENESEVIYEDFHAENPDLSDLCFWPGRPGVNKLYQDKYPYPGSETRFPMDDSFKSRLDDQTVFSLAKLVFNTLKEHPELRGNEHKKWPSPLRMGNVEIVNDDG